jgi:hypothetical protein
MYFAVRSQDLNADLKHYRSSQEILEKELGKNIEDIDRDFMDWFTKSSSEKGNNNPTHDKPCKASANIDPREQQQAPCGPATAK